MTIKRGIQGTLSTQATSPEPFDAFIPNPLPPRPPIEFSPELLKLKERADLALGRLDGVARLLPDLHLFLYFYVRKEAVLSSQIEGTQSSLSDLLLFENEQIPGVPLDDVQEVSNYVAALQHGTDRLKGGFPISIRLIKEIHQVLLSKGRGENKEPGEFRRTQNWIGGTRPGNAKFVPPPVSEVMSAMGSLEKFFHDGAAECSTLVRAALIHVQFETIHPFLDGNGRLGRLLITLLLVADGVLAVPLLYLSLFFKLHRSRYYELLQQVRFEGVWEDWLRILLRSCRVDSPAGCRHSTENIAALCRRQRQSEQSRKNQGFSFAGPSIIATQGIRDHSVSISRIEIDSADSNQRAVRAPETRHCQ